MDKNLGAALRSAAPNANVLQWFEDDLSPASLSQLIASSEPSLILLDAGNGIDLSLYLSVIREARVPCVGIVADLKKREALLKSGLEGVLVKPLVKKEAQDCIQPYLENGKGERASSEARERLQSQTERNERMIMVGRALSSVCHEITNRMQAAHGSLALALEEEGLSEDMRSYLRIAKQETGRVNDLVESLRKIYRPETDKRVEIEIGALLKEVAVLAADELRKSNLNLDLHVEENLPKIRGQSGQLTFILLGLTLNLAALCEVSSQGVVQVQARKIGPSVQIELSVQHEEPLGAKAGKLRAFLGMETAEKIVSAHDGLCGIVANDSGTTVWISLPS
jgi:signal transduction histidine kinase